MDRFACAGLRTVARQHGDGNHDADEANVEHDGQEGEESDSSQTAGQKGAQSPVEGGSARQALDGANPLGDREVLSGQNGQKVGENG